MGPVSDFLTRQGLACDECAISCPHILKPNVEAMRVLARVRGEKLHP